MGCLLGCFEKLSIREEEKTLSHDEELYTYNNNYNYLNYYLATRFELWD
jgi:hypothetical protein